MSMIRIDNAKTNVTPNPTSTGASTGTPYACEAVKRTCQQLRARLMEFGYQMLKEKGDDWCKSQGIDFWNYVPRRRLGRDGDQGQRPHRHGLAVPDPARLREARQPGGRLHREDPRRRGAGAGDDVQARGPAAGHPRHRSDRRTRKLGGGVDSFVGFTYSAACSVVEVDVLTGEMKVISSDIVYDMGWSMNPAIDIGQVEGAFVQGIGYLMTEKLVFEPDGPDRGRLNTTNTWRYKIPAVTTIPLEMNMYLFPRNLPSVRDPREPERHLLRQGGRRAAAGAGQQRVLRDQGGDPRVAPRTQARRPVPVRCAGHRPGSAAGVRTVGCGSVLMAADSMAHLKRY